MTKQAVIDLRELIEYNVPDNVPVQIPIDNTPYSENILELGKNYLKEHPTVRKRARELGRDIITYVQCHSRGIMIGVGLAASTATLTGAYVLYRHRRKRTK